MFVWMLDWYHSYYSPNGPPSSAGPGVWFFWGFGALAFVVFSFLSTMVDANRIVRCVGPVVFAALTGLVGWVVGGIIVFAPLVVAPVGVTWGIHRFVRSRSRRHTRIHITEARAAGDDAAAMVAFIHFRSRWHLTEEKAEKVLGIDLKRRGS